MHVISSEVMKSKEGKTTVAKRKDELREMGREGQEDRERKMQGKRKMKRQRSKDDGGGTG